MGLIKELAKKLIDENPPDAPKDYDVEKLKRLAVIKEAFKEERLKKKCVRAKKGYRCTECGNLFYDEEPLATIPVSVVWCPRCDKLAERFDITGEIS